MFGRFLKPRWQHANPDIRLKAVEQLSPSDDEATLARLARGDSNSLVRAAASGRITDFSLLDEIHQRDEEPSVREAASLRIMALLAGTAEGAPNSETRLRLIRLTGNRDALAYIARNSPDEMCQQAAIERLDDDSLLFELALESKTETLRLEAAQQLRSLSLLKRLSREGRDKRVTRLAREQARALQEKIQLEEAESARVVQLADRLEQHARRSVDALYGPRLEQFEQQWQESRNRATPDLAERVQQALQHCRHQLATLQEETHRQALADTARAEREAAAHNLYQLLSHSEPQAWEAQLGELRSALATQKRRWDSANEQAPAPDNDRQAFDDLVSAFERMLSLATEILDARDDTARLRSLAEQWPTGYPKPPLLSALATEPREEKPASAPGRPTASPHQGLLVALKRELREGNLRHANRLWHKAQAIVEEGDDPALANQLKKLESRRAELQDWHRFAAEPKKVSLCESMEALADSAMDAPQLASAIQALHDEWRALMSSDQDEDQALWDRFKAASDRAYEPCKAHFAEQDALRQQNLEKRRQLCEQLEHFISAQDWSRADWQGIWQIRQQAPKDWKAIQPVRFTDAREVQKRFSAILSDLDDKLKDYVEQAEAARQTLINQATALTEQTDVGEATRQAQQLQKQWRDTPWLPPAQHRAGQKQFKKIMDGLFAERNRQHAERKAEQEARSQEAQSAVERLQNSLDAPFSTDGADDLKDALRAVEQFHSAALPQSLNRQAQQLRRRARERLDRLSEWKHWQALQEKVESLADTNESDETALTLAVAFEALAGVPSPEAERQRRLQWQLEKLPSAMKQQEFAALEEMGRLLDAHDQAVSTAVRNRLLQALAVLEPGSE
jgi:exonuclease SbcC